MEKSFVQRFPHLLVSVSFLSFWVGKRAVGRWCRREVYWRWEIQKGGHRGGSSSGGINGGSGILPGIRGYGPSRQPFAKT